MSPLEYRHSPAPEAEFVAVLPRFGAGPELTEWATQFARMHAGRCFWDAQFVAFTADSRLRQVAFGRNVRVLG